MQVAYQGNQPHQPQAMRLSELLGAVENTLKGQFTQNYRIVAELSEWSQNTKSMHYYGEVVETEENGNKLATCRVACYQYIANELIPKFKAITQSDIRKGLKILITVKVHFHKQYGFSLVIQDIDPTYTIGERELRKKKIIDELTDKDMINNNRSLPAPKEFTQVALLSSETAAGLGDFMQDAKLLDSSGLCQFDFYNVAFQGEQAKDIIIDALRKVYMENKDHSSKHDAVVIIRGGGSQADLDYLNHRDIAFAICCMKIPVFVGVGHERDNTVLDEVAHSSFDTPSKVIGYIKNTIINNAKEADKQIEMIDKIARNVCEHFDHGLKQFYENIYSYSSSFTHLCQDICVQQINTCFDNAAHIIEYTDERLSQNFALSYQWADDAINRMEEQVYQINEYVGVYATNYIDQITINVERTHEQTMYQAESYINFIDHHIESNYQYAHQYSISLYEQYQDKLSQLADDIILKISGLVDKYETKIDSQYHNILSASITPTLNRGFCVTTESNGHYISSSTEAAKHNTLTITYHDGEINVYTKNQ